MKFSFIHFHCYVPFENDKNNYTYLYININEVFCFQFGAVKNNAAITLMHVFFGTPCTPHCWVYTSEEIVGSKDMYLIKYIGPYQRVFPK